MGRFSSIEAYSLGLSHAIVNLVCYLFETFVMTGLETFTIGRPVFDVQIILYSVLQLVRSFRM